MELATQQLSFSYEDAFGPVPDAYETLLRDIVTGDQTLFVRADEVEGSWQLYNPLLHTDALPVHPYRAGTWGPDAASRLLSTWTTTPREDPAVTAEPS
jgi:glucose-6-phosphate 1-dehydrogenase